MMFNSYLPYLISFILFPILIYHKEISKATGLIDYPNYRKKHSSPVSKIGGVYIFLVIIFTSLILIKFFNERLLLSFILLTSGLFLIGFIDDKIEVKATNRLIMQFITIALALSVNNNLTIEFLKIGLVEKEIELISFSSLFTIFCIISLVNAINFVDGIDGLCSILFICFLLMFIFVINNIFNTLLISLLICTILFLIFNLNGKIFLGNSGSYLIGGIISFITVESYNYQKFEIEIIFSIFYLYGLDMLRVYIERLIRGISPFTAENNHLHHYILQCFKNKFLALTIYVLLAVIPFIYQQYFQNFSILLILCFMLYFCSFLFFRKFNN